MRLLINSRCVFGLEEARTQLSSCGDFPEFSTSQYESRTADDSSAILSLDLGLTGFYHLQPKMNLRQHH